MNFQHYFSATVKGIVGREALIILVWMKIFISPICFSVSPWELYRNGNSESSVICQYVCQSVLFVQPIRSFNLISMLVHCLHMKITTCLLVLINQLRKLDNSFSCELVSSLSAYESCLIYLEQSCHSILSSSMPKLVVFQNLRVNSNKSSLYKKIISHVSRNPECFQDCFPADHCVNKLLNDYFTAGKSWQLLFVYLELY